MDGTLLRFDENKFLKMYFQLLCEKTAKIGYEPKKLIDTIWKGTALMYHNNGEKTNEVVFWEANEEHGKGTGCLDQEAGEKEEERRTLRFGDGILP